MVGMNYNSPYGAFPQQKNLDEDREKEMRRRIAIAQGPARTQMVAQLLQEGAKKRPKNVYSTAHGLASLGSELVDAWSGKRQIDRKLEKAEEQEVEYGKIMERGLVELEQGNRTGFASILMEGSDQQKALGAKILAERPTATTAPQWRTLQHADGFDYWIEGPYKNQRVNPDVKMKPPATDGSGKGKDLALWRLDTLEFAGSMNTKDKGYDEWRKRAGPGGDMTTQRPTQRQLKLKAIETQFPEVPEPTRVGLVDEHIEAVKGPDGLMKFVSKVNGDVTASQMPSGRILSTDRQKELRDKQSAIRQVKHSFGRIEELVGTGTGVGSSLSALADTMSGFLKTRYDPNNAESRSKLRLFNQELRGVLASAGRLYKWENEHINKMLVDPDKPFRNPDAQIDRFRANMQYLDNQLAFIASEFGEEAPDSLSMEHMVGASNAAPESVDVPDDIQAILDERKRK